MSKFKPGDRVKVLNNGEGTVLEQIILPTVSDIYKIKLDLGYNIESSQEYLTLMSFGWEPLYSIGDLVEGPKGLRGKIVEIITDPDGTRYAVELSSRIGKMFLLEAELRKVFITCECGAKYNTGFENVHSRWCGMWSEDYK